jgi:hypothetical protein
MHIGVAAVLLAHQERVTFAPALPCHELPDAVLAHLCVVAMHTGSLCSSKERPPLLHVSGCSSGGPLLACFCCRAVRKTVPLPHIMCMIQHGHSPCSRWLVLLSCCRSFPKAGDWVQLLPLGIARSVLQGSVHIRQACRQTANVAVRHALVAQDGCCWSVFCLLMFVQARSGPVARGGGSRGGEQLPAHVAMLSPGKGNRCLVASASGSVASIR